MTLARLSGLTRAAFVFLCTGTALPIFFVFDFGLGVVLSIALLGGLLLVYVLIRPPIWARRWRYEVGEHELYLQHGFLIVEQELIPLFRVQNVDTSSGPIERYFGAASVTISTAGRSSKIPYLSDEVAVALRESIAARARLGGEPDAA